MPKVITLYACNICEQEYATEDEARTCEARGRDAVRFQVGDIVVRTDYIFGWYDGERAWIENFDDVQATTKECSERFCRRCCYRFYYVVTFIDRDDRDPHRTRYHVATKAMQSGYESGYTFNTGHLNMTKVARPPAAVASGSRSLLERKAKGLLR